MKTVTINSRGSWSWLGTRGIGFKYGKMKGLKISPPQSVARIDHTSFLCAENGASSAYPSTRLSTIRSLSYPPSPLSHPPTPPLSLSLFFSVVHLPFRASQAGSRNMPFFKQPIRRRTVYVRAFSSVCGPPWKRGIYEILVKTLLSGLSGRLRRVLGHACTCKRFRPVGRMTPL